MSDIFQSFKIIIFAFIIALGISYGASLLFPKETYVASAGSAQNLSGYAWSDNIGWLSFNCTNTSSCGTSDYGVNVDSSGNFSGYAWSDNIGWVSFNPADTTNCPESPCSPKLDPTTGVVSGWARAVSAIPAPTTLNLVISSNTQNYNIYNSAIAAGWTAGRAVVLTINNGVTVGSNSTSQPALTTGNFPAGTSLTIVNKGIIIGKGGAGGGANSYNSLPESGGHAISVQSDLNIDNMNGYIAGGGGGGGHAFENSNIYTGGGGGAGGGKGGDSRIQINGSPLVLGGVGGEAGFAGGNGGQEISGSYESGYFAGGGGGRIVTGEGGAGANMYIPTSPYASAALGGGSGGGGGASSYYFEISRYFDHLIGGKGGEGGLIGGNGAVNNDSRFGYGGCAGGGGGGFGAGGGSAICSMATYNFSYSAPGSGGKAVNTNDHAITWLGGNNGTQVKGAVN